MSKITPLHRAAEHGHIDAVQLLIDNGAEIDAINNHYHHMQTPLFIAFLNSHHNISRLLIHYGANIRVLKTIHDPFQVIIEDGQIDLVEHLIEADADVNERYDYNTTPLMIAAEHGRNDIIRLLLKHGAETDHTNYDCRTAKWYAVANGHKESAKILIRHDIDQLQREMDQLYGEIDQLSEDGS
jgi:ankyrin repeat protein